MHTHVAIGERTTTDKLNHTEGESSPSSGGSSVCVQNVNENRERKGGEGESFIKSVQNSFICDGAVYMLVQLLMLRSVVWCGG